ncbi:thioredoxin family protein [Streptomyces sp. NBC_01724]|uniref:TlpA family protein disulfide reductase n=1 Tax=unclassified Streptomyces TaxID=2593676 RepID=UPI0028C4CE65|nr:MULTISPECIES: thioredoxin family protein [unclassified Streptomyces]WNO62931.1 thioredoxin family protein [Streptomyces sp. AM2-3-1]WSC67509.1 thioredoxin family protein [Streptomyces sp. NBC_01760]WTE57880.1 thioredoxin family protein [Streptomyces sp. NBC_01617]WTI85396.1 thioredoxin family protein [Streptomyces sp. NBC_00724]
MTGLVVCVAVLVLASIFGVVQAARSGRLRSRPTDGAVRLSAAEIGAEMGERVTLLQFSTAVCQPCRATRRMLAEVAATVPGAVHVEIDAEARLELVRRLEILRTPTVFVLDPTGRVVGRASGQPRRADVIAAIGEATGASITPS